jgi:predicted LPLAT superfamily acyltransferase
MHRALISLSRILPLRLLYGGMSLAIPFYVLLDGRGRRASYSFFRNRMGYGRVRSFLHVFVNMYNMGKVVIDRFAAYAGKQFRISGQDRYLYDILVPDGTYMMLSSHVGNFELSGYMIPSPRPVKTLVYAGENAQVMAQRSRLFKDCNIEMVPVKEDMSHLFILNEALQNGEVVSVAADRSFGSSKTVRCQFMGQEAPFPAGPFTLAVRRGAKVLAVFVVKEGVRDFRAIVEELQADGTGQARVESLAKAYATVLERVTRQYPDQWFNFYDFWAA